MKTLYLECRMGCAGDMLAAALSELTDQEAFVRTMNACGLDGIEVKAEKMRKSGIAGTHLHVYVHGEEEHVHDVHDHEHAHDHKHSNHSHHHVHMSDIEDMIRKLNVSERVREDAIAVYQLLAEAESHAHDCPVEEIHFHEVGMKDAVADIVGVCVLMEMIGAEKVLASPVAAGSGFVRCAHGILPVPAPATAYLLKGIPCMSGNEDGELLTPTGAALLKYFVQSFEAMPVMTIEKTGYGFGTKEFKKLNAVRAFLAEMKDTGEVIELVCNLDDMTPEEVGFATETLMAAGALDVYTIPAFMKKNRPGLLFTCMCREEDREKMIALIFRHTTTLGLREQATKRHALDREVSEVSIGESTVRRKRSYGYGTERTKLEYEDLAKIAREEGISLFEARKRFEK